MIKNHKTSKPKIVSYDLFSKHYDEIMGDRSENANTLQKLISKYHPKAKSILELACGTGSVLQHFKKYELFGLDISQGMLGIAKMKVPNASFSMQSMTSFKFDKKFDVILCVYDSINHLLDFSDWEKVFKQSFEHLNDDGVLIFDMNTKVKLQRVINAPPWPLSFNKNLMIMDVTDAGKDLSNWNIKVFDHKEGNKYELYEENIKEIAFDASRVKKALGKYKKVSVIDTDRKNPTQKSERLIFICEK